MGDLRLRYSEEDCFTAFEEFFYKRGYDQRATTAIAVEEVKDAVLSQLQLVDMVPNYSIAE